MSGPLHMPGRLLVVGANHRTSSLSLRDNLFVEDGDIPGVLNRLSAAGIDNAVVLSTCDRVEVVAVVEASDHPTSDEDVEKSTASILQVMAAKAGEAAEDIADQFYIHTDADAVRHIFAVTSSLDSLVIGEPQVFGQVKAAHRMARDADMAGGALDRILQAAYATAKKVRTDTDIGRHPVSIAAAARQIARDLHGDMDKCSALLLGIGDMGELIAEQMQSAGLRSLTVVHPVEARAQGMARTLDCHWTALENLADVLADADIVLAALGGRRHALSGDMVRTALRRRRRKPIFFIDTAIPGDVEPSVARLDEAFVFDLGDLEQVAMEGRATREAGAKKAWDIVDKALAAFLNTRASRTTVPVTTALRQHFEEVRDGVIRDAGGDVEKATRLLVNRLLHNPTEALRRAGGDDNGDSGDWHLMQDALTRLFPLGNDDEENG